MWTKSLSLRVALIAAGGSALALVVAGAVFILQFSGAVERNFDGRLETLLLTLIANTDVDGNVDENAVEGGAEEASRVRSPVGTGRRAIPCRRTQSTGRPRSPSTSFPSKIFPPPPNRHAPSRSWRAAGGSCVRASNW